MIQPLNNASVTPEYVFQQIIKENPISILVVMQNKQAQYRFIHSSMPLEIRAYMVQIAQSVVHQVIIQNTQVGDPVTPIPIV